jgi:SAM-dependent methyltransferase
MDQALIIHPKQILPLSSVPEKAEPFSLHQTRHVAMMKLLRILRTNFQEPCAEIPDAPSLNPFDQYLLGLIGAVALAKRSLIPNLLTNSRLSTFISAYALEIGIRAPFSDLTGFAEVGAKLFEPCLSTGFDSFINAHQDKLIKVLAQFHTQAELDEPLSTGWLKQCLIKTSMPSNNTMDGHRTRASLDDLGQLTQWFTPAWIADFLVEESLDGEAGAVFLDPACGAGHLLVPALRKLFSLKKQNSSAVDALALILDKQLFGIDIDPHLLELANFALYLQARDLAGIVDLPRANLLSIDGSDEDRAIGSLLLPVDGLASSAKVSHPGQKTKHIKTLPKKFDAVAMNPPYLSHRVMPQAIRNFLNRNYPHSQYDLYAAFLELGLRLLAPGGKLAAICQQSVLTVQRYESLRATMLKDADMEVVVQLGSGAFATKSGEKTNNAIITFRKRGQAKRQNLRCWQILTRADKLSAETHGIDHLPARIISCTDADKISALMPKSPFAFWAPQEILQLFKKHPALEDNENGIICTNGLFTCNNEKFVQRHDQIEPGTAHDYVPYDKGGGHKWYRTSPLVLLWKKDGQEIREYRRKRGQSARLPGEGYYFKQGVTYSYIGTRGFKARLLTPNSVFDVASSAVFSETVDILYILGFLNSSLARSILGVLNPTINFQIGDIRRLPFKIPQADVQLAISDLVSKAVALAKEIETFDPGSPRFKGHVAERYGGDPINAHEKHLFQCNAWAGEERLIQSQIDTIIFDMYEISSSCQQSICEDPWVTRGADTFAKAAALLRTTCRRC